jgi:hypothetical protein
MDTTEYTEKTMYFVPPKETKKWYQKEKKQPSSKSTKGNEYSQLDSAVYIQAPNSTETTTLLPEDTIAVGQKYKK